MTPIPPSSDKNSMNSIISRFSNSRILQSLPQQPISSLVNIISSIFDKKVCQSSGQQVANFPQSTIQERGGYTNGMFRLRNGYFQPSLFNSIIRNRFSRDSFLFSNFNPSCQSFEDVENLVSLLKEGPLKLSPHNPEFYESKVKILSEIGRYLHYQTPQHLWNFSEFFKSVVETQQIMSRYQINCIYKLISRRQLLFYGYSLFKQTQELASICSELNIQNFSTHYRLLMPIFLIQLEKCKQSLERFEKELYVHFNDKKNGNDENLIDSSFLLDPAQNFCKLREIIEQKKEDFKSCAKDLLKLNDAIIKLDGLGRLLDKEFPLDSDSQVISSEEKELEDTFTTMDLLIAEFASNPNLQFQSQQHFVDKLKEQAFQSDQKMGNYLSYINSNLSILENQMQHGLDWLSRSNTSNPLAKAGVEVKRNQLNECHRVIGFMHNKLRLLINLISIDQKKYHDKLIEILPQQQKLNSQVESLFKSWNHEEVIQAHQKISEALKEIPSIEVLTPSFDRFVYQWKRIFNKHVESYSQIQQIRDQIDPLNVLKNIDPCTQFMLNDSYTLLINYHQIACSYLFNSDSDSVT